MHWGLKGKALGPAGLGFHPSSGPEQLGTRGGGGYVMFLDAGFLSCEMKVRPGPTSKVAVRPKRVSTCDGLEARLLRVRGGTPSVRS